MASWRPDRAQRLICGTGSAAGGSQTQGNCLLLLQNCLLVGQVSLQRGADGSQYIGV